MEKEKFLGLLVSEIKFSTKSRLNKLVRWLLWVIKPQGFDYNNIHDTKKVSAWATRFKISDIIQASEQSNDIEIESLWSKELVDFFIKCGFSKLDWNFLPVESVTIKVLKKVGKPELIKLDIALLNTLPNQALNYIASTIKHNRSIEDFESCATIGELLGVSRVHAGKHNFTQSLLATRKKLLEIGFKYEEGVFLQRGTRRLFVEELIREEGYSKKKAQEIANLARKKGWVNTPEWDLVL